MLRRGISHDLRNRYRKSGWLESIGAGALDVKMDFEPERIQRSEFDEVNKDIRKYIQEKLRIGKMPDRCG
jgi:hypothetical protein